MLSQNQGVRRTWESKYPTHFCLANQEAFFGKVRFWTLANCSYLLKAAQSCSKKWDPYKYTYTGNVGNSYTDQIGITHTFSVLPHMKIAIPKTKYLYENLLVGFTYSNLFWPSKKYLYNSFNCNPHHQISKSQSAK